MAEFDPPPRYIVASLRGSWVWGSIRTHHLWNEVSISDVLIEDAGSRQNVNYLRNHFNRHRRIIESCQ